MPTEQKVKSVPFERPPEVPKTPEKPVETTRVVAAEQVLPAAEAVAVPAPRMLIPVAPVPKAPMLVKIEGILAEDLAEVYENLPAALKPQFRAKGEETAGKIKQLMQDAKVKARKVLKLIKEWLKMIPGVNKFFLEQEATIKTQKLLGIKMDEHHEE